MIYELCRTAEKQRPGWQDIIAIVRATSRRRTRFEHGNLVGRIAEVYAIEQLRMASAKLRLDDVDIIDIAHGAETENYIFYKQNAGRFGIYCATSVLNKGSGQWDPDIDGLVVVGGEPFLLEVKAQKYRRYARYSGIGSTTRGSIARVMQHPEELSIRAAAEYLGTGMDMKLMVALPPDQFYPTPGTIQQSFLDRGGLVLRLAHGADMIAQAASALAQECGYRVA